MKNKFENKFVKNVLALSSGTFLAQLLLFLTSPLLTRLFSLENFGQLAIFTSFLSIFMYSLSLRYELAFINISVLKEKLKLLKLLILLVIINALLVVIILMLLEFWSIVEYFNNTFMYILLLLSLVGIGIFNVFEHFAISEGKFKSLSISTIQQTLTLVVVQLLGGVLSLNKGLILGDSISRWSGITVLVKSLTKEQFIYLLNVKLREGIKYLKIYSDYAKYSSISGITNNFVMQSPPIILALYFQQPLIGLFTILQRVLVVPIKLISQAVRQAYTNRLKEYITNHKYSDLKIFMKKIVLILFALSICPSILLYLYGENILILIFGNNLENSERTLRILLIYSISQFIFIPIANTLEFLNKQKIIFYWQLVRFIFVVVILIGMPYFNFNFQQTLLGYVSIMSLFYIMLFIINLLLLNKIEGSSTISEGGTYEKQ
ncbi:lipopolysaccharide biosynthesis protein [Macrococcus brunensis]|uniref:lipopolysaccharide biosynthesis protein n=1 Tax=Macrococcus brunensis TaxID=198483 RepID=UPI001EF0CC00|nr:hypothetical protein [Macrococcus brunensis]ULG74947.1 hypothetical protein MGG13_04060 [Macrococcus brunensis]